MKLYPDLPISPNFEAIVLLQSRLTGQIHAAWLNSEGQPHAATFCGYPIYGDDLEQRMDPTEEREPACPVCARELLNWNARWKDQR